MHYCSPVTRVKAAHHESWLQSLPMVNNRFIGDMLKWVGTHGNARSQAGKIVFIIYGNATRDSEFGQDNGLIRNTQGSAKLK